MTTRELAIPEGLEGIRADAGLCRILGLSRSKTAELIESGFVSVDGKPARKSDLLKADAWLSITIPDQAEPEEPAELPDMKILYQDRDIVVVDKPVGVAAHPSARWAGPTVTGVLRSLGVTLTDAGPPERQGIVHRLDAGTSGLMVLAKSVRAYSGLKRAFRDREVSKTYNALVQGHPDPRSGTIDAPIGRHPRLEGRFAVVSDGKPSITHYTTLDSLARAALLEVQLETGRTHQIRVHFSALHHQLVGDSQYGCDPRLAAHLGLSRQWLHAVELGFIHPGTGRHIDFSSEYPQDLTEALNILRAES